MKELTNPPEKKELVKHTAAIHCSNSLTLLQRKISNVLLYHAYQHLLDHEEHKISIKELCHYLHYKGNNYEVIKQALRALIATVIEWNLTDDQTGEEDWTASSMLASVNIRQAICTYAYSPRMRKLLFTPSMYGKINLMIQSQFTSSYGLALYENCIRYRGLTHTKVFTLDQFRKIMGVPDNQYTVFRDLKRRVLDKAVEEVNKFTELLIEPEINRAGRKVVSIRFKIETRQKKKRLAASSPILGQGDDMKCAEINQELVSKLNQAYGLNTETVRELFEHYGAEKVWHAVAQLESSKQFLEGKINNCGGYLISYLANDFSLVTSAEVVQQQKLQEEQSRAVEDKKQRQLEEVKRQYTRHKNDLICDAFLKLNNEEQGKISEAFLDYLSSQNNKFILEKAKKGNLVAGMTQPIFCQFLREHHPYLALSTQSLEEYLKEKT